MRFLIKLITLITLVVASYSSHAQLMQSINDAQKIIDNEQFFRDKPLKILLQEIGPKIEMVMANGVGSSERLTYFVFRFMDKEEQKEYYREGKKPITIHVKTKENFEWEKHNLLESEREQWTKQDAIKYGNITIAYIKVYGDNL
jgi:hypothetical protein